MVCSEKLIGNESYASHDGIGRMNQEEWQWTCAIPPTLIPRRVSRTDLCIAPPFPRTRNVTLDSGFRFVVELMPGLPEATGCPMHVPVTLSYHSSKPIGMFRLYEDGCCWERDPLSDRNSAPENTILSVGRFAANAGPTRILFEMIPADATCINDGTQWYGGEYIRLSRIFPGPVTSLGFLPWKIGSAGDMLPVPRFVSVGGLGANETDWSALVYLASQSALPQDQDICGSNGVTASGQSVLFPSLGSGVVGFELNDPFPSGYITDPNNTLKPAEIVLVDGSDRRLGTVQFETGSDGLPVVSWYAGTAVDTATPVALSSAIPLRTPLRLRVHGGSVSIGVDGATGYEIATWKQPYLARVSGITVNTHTLRGSNASIQMPGLGISLQPTGLADPAVPTFAIQSSALLQQQQQQQQQGSSLLGQLQQVDTGQSLTATQTPDLGSIIPSSLNPFKRIERWFRSHWLIIVLVILVVVLFLAVIFKK